MAERDQVIAYCDELLEAARFADYCPNGMQVPGRREVGRVATAVSAHRETIERACEIEADLLITHHGLFWTFHPRALSEQMAERLRLCLLSGLTVAGYHLPLDAHPELGNNALLCRRLGFDPGTPPQRVAEVKGERIGVVGRLDGGITIGELTERLASELGGREPLVQGDGPDLVESLAVVTGSAAGELGEAVALGLDAYLTGEPAEHAMADAAEGGIHFLAAGHYATETFGVRALGERLAERFDLEHTFLDVPNPV